MPRQRSQHFKCLIVERDDPPFMVFRLGKRNETFAGIDLRPG
jgi:hypothetical protein